MVRLNPVVTLAIVLGSYFGLGKSTTANDDHRSSARSLYNALDDGYRSTLALIIEDFILANSTIPFVWSNPIYAVYDQQLVYALQDQLGDSYNKYDHQDETKDDQVPLLPMYDALRFLTFYCGPGNWSIDGDTVQTPYFSSIDLCCKQHDECPDVIVHRDDYQRYSSLPYKMQFFTSLRCDCDVQFLRCLKNIATFFSYAVAWIYTKFQSSCFDREYPVLKCTMQKNNGFFSSDRCLTYLVDNSYPKNWQWFDVPYISSGQFYFPKVQYRYAGLVRSFTYS